MDCANFDLTMNDSAMLNITDDQMHVIPDNINEVQVKNNIFPSQNQGSTATQPPSHTQPPLQMGSFLQNGGVISFVDNIEL